MFFFNSILRKAFIRLALITGLMALVCGTFFFVYFSNSVKSRIELLVRINRSDLLVGDYRQAQLSLNTAIELGFSQVTFFDRRGTKIFELGHAENNLFNVKYLMPVSLDERTDGLAHLEFWVNYEPLTLGFLFGLVALIGFNIASVGLSATRIVREHDKEMEGLRLIQVGALARQVAHDIRSPLSIVRICGEKLRTSNVQLSEALLAAAQRIDKIAEDLLQKNKSAKLESGIDLAKLECMIEELFKELRSRYPNQKIKFSKVFSGETNFEVNLDFISLTRTLSNLLVNSCEATIDRDGEVMVTVDGNLSILRIEVRDNGKGFSKEALLAFRRREFGTWGKADGNGLGLRFAVESIEKLGGRFSIESKLGEGSSILMEISVGELS